MRHQRDERCRHVEVAEIGDLHDLAADPPAQLLGLVVWPLEQFFEQPELVEDPQRRGVNRVPPEIAQEVGMLLQHQRLHPRPREQQPGDHPRRPAANDHHFCFSHWCFSHRLTNLLRCG